VHSCCHRSTEQRVPDTGRRVGQIAHDAPPSVGAANDIDGIVREPSSMWSLSERCEAVPGTPPPRHMIDDPVAQQRPGAVQVVDGESEVLRRRGDDVRRRDDVGVVGVDDVAQDDLREQFEAAALVKLETLV
jgi:hypothetical protein